MKHLITFTKLELLNLFGRNVYKHVKDPSEKKRKTLLGVTLLFVALVLGGYLASGAYALTILGAGDKVPMLYSLLSCIFILMFGAFKAKSNLYREKDLAFLASLPVKSLPIVTARLIRSCAENALLNALLILPAFLICGILGKLGIAFFLNLALTLLILPILPTALTAWFGILISALTAHNRHKVLTETALSLIIGVGAMILPFIFLPHGSSGDLQIIFSGNASSTEVTKELSLQVANVFETFENSFPVVRHWGSLFLGENLGGLLLYGLTSLILVFLTALVIGKNFFAISARLFPQTEHREFHMTEIQSKTILTALIQKEARRYFSCGIYVTNTIFGPVLGVIFAVSLGFFDPMTLFSGAENLPVELNPQAGIPFILGMIFSLMTLTASSVSMEGKNWWILQSLPVSIRDVMHAKLLFNFLFIAPFYVLSEIILLFTVQADPLERLWLLLVPAAAILFSVTFGLFVNKKLPKFQWESATEVVKQSAATGISMLSLFVILLPGMGAMLLKGNLIHLVTLGFIAVICAATLLIYRKVIA